MSEPPRAGRQNFLLRQAREEQDLSQSQVADKIGVNERTYRRWENEGQIPGWYAQRKLLRLFGKTTPGALGFREHTRRISFLSQPTQQAAQEEAGRERTSLSEASPGREDPSVPTPPVVEPEEPILGEQQTSSPSPHFICTPLRFSWRKLLLSGLILGTLLLALLVSWGVRPRPMLSGDFHPTPASVNLTQEGRRDWVHWGYLTSDIGNPSQFLGNPVLIDCHYTPHCLNRKQQGNSFISDYTPIGHVDPSHLPYRLYFKDGPQFSWTNGVPVAIGANVRTTEYMAFVGNGFQLQVAADQTVHTLRIYLGVYQGQIKCRAVLSDHSAPAFTDTTLNTFDLFDTDRAVYYSFTYRAASSGQTLTVTVTLASALGGANVSLTAATLQ
jgi:DNA-binding XRE family transcriptional regulator